MLDPFVNCNRPLLYIIKNLIISYTTREWLIKYCNAPYLITLLQNILGAVKLWGKLKDLDTTSPTHSLGHWHSVFCNL